MASAQGSGCDEAENDQGPIAVISIQSKDEFASHWTVLSQRLVGIDSSQKSP